MEDSVEYKERIMIVLEIIGMAAIIELIITITAFVIVEKISWR